MLARAGRRAVVSMGDAAAAAAMAPPPPLPPLDVRSIGHPSVRDLAWVLTMPQVLTGSPRYFPLWPGLGADATASHACRELLERLDADPRPLEAFLAARRKTRLGDRFEALCHYALAHVALPRAGGGDAEPLEAQPVAALRWGVQVHDARPAAEAYLGGGAVGRTPLSPPGGGGRRGRFDDAALGGASEVGRDGRGGEAAAADPPAAAVVSDDAEQLRRLASLSMGDGGAGAAYVQWQGRRMEAELRRRERNRSAAKRAQARRAAEVTIGELDFVFLDDASDSSSSSGSRPPGPPPVVRHVEVSVKYLLWSPALTDAKRAGGVAPDMPRGTGIVCGCSRCCPPDAATSSTAAGSAPAAPAPQDECAVAWSAGLDGFHGPHRIESLTLKIRRGSAQLALALAPRAQEWLRAYVAEAAGGASTTALSSAPAPPLPHPPVAVTSSYVLKGYLFYPLAEWAWRGDKDGGGVGRRPRQCVWSDECLSPALLAALPASVPARHPAGWYTDSVDALLARRPASRWVVLPKPFWLGPLVVPCEPDEAEAMERGWAAAAAGAEPAATAAPHPASLPAGPHSALDPAPVLLLPAHMSVDAFDQMTSAEEKARVVARLRAHAVHMRREPPGAPVPGGSAGPSGGFIKYAGPGSELTLWGGLGRNALPRVSDGARLAADVAANHAAAVRCASARALRLLVAEVVYDPGWDNGAGARQPPSHPHAGDSGTGCPPQTRDRTPPGAWVEVSRGFVVEDGWATEGDAAHAARFGEEMPVGQGAKRAGAGAGSGAGARRGPGVDAYV